MQRDLFCVPVIGPSPLLDTHLRISLSQRMSNMGRTGECQMPVRRALGELHGELSLT